MIFESGIIAPLYATSIGVNTMAAALVFATGLTLQRRHYLTLGVLCICAAIYQFCNWQYHTSDSLETATFWLKWQSGITLFTLPFLYYTFGAWAREKHANKIILFFFTLAFFSLIYNWFSPYGFRLNTVETFYVFELSTGENVSLLKGSNSVWGKAVHILSILMTAYLLYVSYLLWTKRRILLAVTIGIFLCLQGISSYIGLLIDSGELDFFYVAGLPLTIMNIFICFLIATSLSVKTQRLRKQTARTAELEKVISKLASGVSSLDSLTFYHDMLRGIYDLSGADIIFIGLRDDSGQAPQIRTMAVINKGDIADNFTYELAHTPCENVFDDQMCIYTEKVAQLFPQDQMLADMGLEAYIGLPIHDASAELIGILVVLHTSPLKPDEKLKEMIRIFASRASAELRRNTLEQKLRRMAYFDYTTNLPNRSSLFDAIKSHFEVDASQNTSHLLLVIDLCRFTEINRVYGYDAAETMLRQIGLRMQEVAEECVLVARYGGDEFAILVKIEGDLNRAFGLQSKKVRHMIQTPVHVGHIEISLDCNIGGVVYPDQVRNRGDVLRSAETALVEAKKEGRGISRLFDPLLLRQLDKKQAIESKLEAALEQNEQLRLVYQPKTDSSGNLVGTEVLMRWLHPEDGFIPPDEFIPIAEESGLIHPLGDWLVHAVCQQITDWKQSDVQINGKVGINISAFQFAKEDFVGHLLDIVNKYHVQPSEIEIELTETGLLKDTKKAIHILEQLKRSGFSIALDDFGTGYSSLSYLRELPIDVLKIDKSFVDQIDDERASELIGSIISIGKHMQLEVIAEGTESASQVQKLSALGCEQFQGYFFSKPLPPEEFAEWEFIEESN